MTERNRLLIECSIQGRDGLVFTVADRTVPIMTNQRRLPTRRDAVANRERLLSGAEVYFAENGLDAPLHGLADFVGVGIGTLYRNFPHHSDLIRELFDRVVERFDVVIAACDEQATGWGAIEMLLYQGIDTLVQYPATAAIMRRQNRNDPEVSRTRNWGELIDGYLRRAQKEGKVRSDIHGADLATALLALSTLQSFPEDIRRVVAVRLVTLLIDGIRERPEGLTTLPEPPVSIREHYSLVHN